MEKPFSFVERKDKSEASFSSSLNEEVRDEYCPCCYRVRGALCETWTASEIIEKIRGVRVLLYAQGLDGLLVPSGDAHSSEYVAACDERRAWLTGFTGSAGLALVTRKEALLWTDGRYFNQAATQLKDTGIKLMKQKEAGVLEPGEYCAQNNILKVGIDPATCTLSFAEEFRRQVSCLKTSNSHENVCTLLPTEDNIIDLVWSKQRPARPSNKIMPQPIALTGSSTEDKLSQVRSWLTEQNTHGIIINALDQIAWLTNLRGSDIECNPVFFSYAIITSDRAVLFVANDSDPSFKEYLTPSWEIHKYSHFVPNVITEILKNANTIALERSTATMAMSQGLETKKGSSLKMIDVSPIENMKAIKNQAEIQGLRQAQLRDAAVICTFFAWLNDQLASLQASTITEAMAADEITRLRALFKDTYRGDSFPTISSSGANAAIIHYQPTHDECSKIDPNKVYLCDTGAQYIDGTTDITRTLYIGPNPSSDELRCYTLVLMGHIDLARAHFPEGTSGLQLDALARAPLWSQGFDFNHGTGHGMGAYLNVHEGPFGIGGGALPASKLSNAAKLRYLTGIHKGFYLSDEPGIYVDGKYGFRLESDLLVIDSPKNLPGIELNPNSRNFLCFEYLTIVPFCRKLIYPDLLSPHHRSWLNAFHAGAFRALEEFLSDPSCPLPNTKATLAWLSQACAPI